MPVLWSSAANVFLVCDLIGVLFFKKELPWLLTLSTWRYLLWVWKVEDTLLVNF